MDVINLKAISQIEEYQLQEQERTSKKRVVLKVYGVPLPLWASTTMRKAYPKARNQWAISRPPCSCRS